MKNVKVVPAHSPPDFPNACIVMKVDLAMRLKTAIEAFRSPPRGIQVGVTDDQPATLEAKITELGQPLPITIN